MQKKPYTVVITRKVVPSRQSGISNGWEEWSDYLPWTCNEMSSGMWWRMPSLITILSIWDSISKVRLRGRKSHRILKNIIGTINNMIVKSRMVDLMNVWFERLSIPSVDMACRKMQRLKPLFVPFWFYLFAMLSTLIAHVFSRWNKSPFNDNFIVRKWRSLLNFIPPLYPPISTPFFRCQSVVDWKPWIIDQIRTKNLSLTKSREMSEYSKKINPLTFLLFHAV